ncbi:MAG: HNH endonuclease [Anaerolineae bacterium]|nr:MAG: HNH endonuclease [Anaerolineae bacterium]
MNNEILSYLEMCQLEGVNLQKGMNYRLGGDYSVILMSLRKGAPYQDQVSEDGQMIIYEGHDIPKTEGVVDSKNHDQSDITRFGTLTENGKFHRAAQEYKKGLRSPEHVRVYEKIRNGIWSNNGVFELIDSWIENDGARNVFRFRLQLVQLETERNKIHDELPNTRVIPSHVKIAVWKRDKGQCVICGASEHLHFDHIIPFSKGGSSLVADNIQLLCAQHNLAKRDRIE